MFDIGFWELALIGIVALLVVGPEKMPGLIRTAGQWAGQVQRMARDLRREIELEAHGEEYKALNQQFREEDKRLKELARNPLAAISRPPADGSDAATGTQPASPGVDSPGVNSPAATSPGANSRGVDTPGTDTPARTGTEPGNSG